MSDALRTQQSLFGIDPSNTDYTYIDKFVKQSSNSKDLLTRSTGRFYTNEFVGKNMIEAVLEAANIGNLETINVVEPFCGDGRLVCWLLESYSRINSEKDKQWKIDLWDCDPQALAHAHRKVESTAQRLNQNVEINSIVGDSFRQAESYYGKFHICVTNPPWEVLKPDHRELNNLCKLEEKEYINFIKQQNNILSNLYPLSSPSKKFAGWGMNLSRCGTEAALRLLAPGGVCGLISPVSLLADQSSNTLRKWIFNSFTFHEVSYYSAEARLFEKVDQPVITLVLSANTTKIHFPILTLYDKNLSKKIKPLEPKEWETIRIDDYIFPLQFGCELLQLKNKWESLPRFVDLENEKVDGLWAGRELDETNYQRFLSDEGKNLFLKGRMIKRFGLAIEPTQYISSNGPNIPKSVDYTRIVWRDVSRPTQKRRVIASIISPGIVTGNSLHVAYFRNNDLRRLKILLAILSSLVMEAQIRMQLATNHISLGVVRKSALPLSFFKEVDNLIPSLVDRCTAGDEMAPYALEVLVAKMYGLTKDDFALLISAYEKIDNSEREHLLSSSLWNS